MSQNPANDQLLQRTAILETMARYCHYFDRADFENWLDLFTEDGAFELIGRSGSHNGKAALRAFTERIPVKDGTTQMMHIVSNEVIDFDSDTAGQTDLSSARAMSYILVVRPDGARPLASWLAGRYEDHLLKQDGKWRFKTRRVHFDYLGELSQ